MESRKERVIGSLNYPHIMWLKGQQGINLAMQWSRQAAVIPLTQPQASLTYLDSHPAYNAVSIQQCISCSLQHRWNFISSPPKASPDWVSRYSWPNNPTCITNSLLSMYTWRWADFKVLVLGGYMLPEAKDACQRSVMHFSHPEQGGGRVHCHSKCTTQWLTSMSPPTLAAHIWRTWHIKLWMFSSQVNWLQPKARKILAVIPFSFIYSFMISKLWERVPNASFSKKLPVPCETLL